MTALRAFIVIGLAGFWLFVCAPPMFQTPPQIYSGVHLVLTGGAVQPNIVRVDPGSPAYRAGLRTGEILGCLSRRDSALLFNEAFGAQQGYQPGSVISTCVRRGGKLETVQFVAQTRGIVENSYGSNALSALRVGVFIIFLLTGIALVMARPSLMTWIFFGYCLANSPTFAATEVYTVLSNWQYNAVLAVPGILNGLGVALLMLFAILVPNEGIPPGWRRTAFYIGVMLTLADLAFGIFSQFYTAVTLSINVSNAIDEGLTTLTVLLVLARLATMERDERARFGWAAFAIIFGVICNDLRNVLSNVTSKELQSLSVIAADLTIIMPLALTYAILKRHVIDVRFVISRTVVYAALTTLVVVVIGAVDWLTSAYLSQVRVAMAIDAAVTIGLAFVLHRTYGWIERAVDFLLYRRKHAAETYLNRLAKTLLRAQREETIDRALVHAPYEKLDLTMAALFRQDGGAFIVSSCAGCDLLGTPPIDGDHELVRFLVTERVKLDIRDMRAHVVQQFHSAGTVPAIAIPIFQGDELTAFAIYGIHRDGTKLDPDEVETLEHMCEMGAQAYVRIELLRYRAISQPLPA